MADKTQGYHSAFVSPDKAENPQWRLVRQKLLENLGEDIFYSWFAGVEFVSFEEDCVHLSVPTLFLRNWISAHYRDALIGVWQDECPHIDNCRLSVRGVLHNRIARPAASANDALPEGAGPGSPSAAAQPDRLAGRAGRAGAPKSGAERLNGAAVDGAHTFQSFAEADSNRLARTTAMQMTMGECSFNPLYIYGAVGRGKTHLLHAIYHKARAAGQNVLYLTAEYFVIRFVSAMRQNSALSFKRAIRDVDLLLVDDIQLLSGKNCQVEFCDTFNALINRGRRVAVASDQLPGELSNLHERVCSRLASGLLAEIGAPELSLRREILNVYVTRMRSRHPHFDPPPGVLDYVAGHVTSSGRDLEGALNRLVALNQIEGQPLTEELVAQKLRDLVQGGEARKVSIEDIQRIVSKYYQISRTDLLSARRPKNIVRPRQIAMYMSKLMTRRSLPEIGRRFGNRDHTTVLHAVRKVEQLRQSDASIDGDIRQLHKILCD